MQTTYKFSGEWVLVSYRHSMGIYCVNLQHRQLINYKCQKNSMCLYTLLHIPRTITSMEWLCCNEALIRRTPLSPDLLYWEQMQNVAGSWQCSRSRINPEEKYHIALFNLSTPWTFKVLNAMKVFSKKKGECKQQYQRCVYSDRK